MIIDFCVWVVMGDCCLLVFYVGDDSGYIGDGGNLFGLVGVIVIFCEKFLGGNFFVIVNWGCKKWFLMCCYGGYGVFRCVVL